MLASLQPRPQDLLDIQNGCVPGSGLLPARRHFENRGDLGDEFEPHVEISLIIKGWFTLRHKHKHKKIFHFLMLMLMLLRPPQTRKHCCGNIVADANVFLFARARNICCGLKKSSSILHLLPVNCFLVCAARKQNICFASHSFARRGNINEQQCFRNNVSSFAGSLCCVCEPVVHKYKHKHKHKYVCSFPVSGKTRKQSPVPL